jgi:DNA-binding IclR family transcriptional regulator
MDTKMPFDARGRVMETLRTATQHLTIADLARAAQVSTTTVRTVLDSLDAEGRLDIDRDWPNSYLLQPAAPALASRNP